METATAVPVARALQTLELVQRRPGITAAELSTRLEVSERAVRRYVSTLRAAGLTIEARRGRHGGYHVGRSARPAPFVFSASEALGLVMAVLDSHHAAADPDDLVGSALGKLIASMPDHTARQAARVVEHARATPDRRAARPGAAVTSTLVEAIAQRRGIHLRYTTQAGRHLETDADPWAIIVRHGRWYLACFSHVPAAARAYRIDRIDHVHLRNVDVDLPDLDPVRWLDEHLATGWAHDSCVEFDAPIDRVAPWVPAPMGRLEPIDDGQRCRLTGSTDNPTMYAGEWLAAVPVPFRVIGGPELSEAVQAVGRRLLRSVESA